ncbi:hypothetical protein H1C71_029142, partial [Ictidomys tridecemlineatus]
ARLFVSVYRNGSSRCWAVVVRVETGPLKTLRSAPSTSHEQCSRGKALGSGRWTVAVEPARSPGRKDNSRSLDGLIQHRVALSTQDPAKGGPCPRVSGSKVTAGVRARTTTLHTRDVCVALREPEVPRSAGLPAGCHRALPVPSGLELKTLPSRPAPGKPGRGCEIWKSPLGGFL